MSVRIINIMGNVGVQIIALLKNNMTTAEKITNVILYGNPKGDPNPRKGKVTHEYDEFLSKVFNHNK